ncbi:hypothetical protein M0R45_002256 [Rubus argutus]|uniref:Uncharacterized protein n=1 Tax=Rubus argutus TaxID=59490 RepID=A0AAW1VJX8_RUBAR
MSIYGNKFAEWSLEIHEQRVPDPATVKVVRGATPRSCRSMQGPGLGLTEDIGELACACDEPWWFVEVRD